jgi:hypothetical protein
VTVVLGPLINLLGSKKLKKILVTPRSKDLAVLKEMAEKGKLVPVFRKSLFYGPNPGGTYSKSIRAGCGKSRCEGRLIFLKKVPIF